MKDKKSAFWLLCVSIAVCMIAAACFLAASPDYAKITEIVITNGNNGEQKTFRSTDSSNGFNGLLDFIHTVTPYKDGFSMDAIVYPPNEEQAGDIITRVLSTTAYAWNNTAEFKEDADILIKMAEDSTGAYEVYGISSKELGDYGLVLNNIIDGEDNYNYVFTPWFYTGVPQDEPRLEWSEDGKVLRFSYVVAADQDNKIWNHCIVDCGYETGHMKLIGMEE